MARKKEKKAKKRGLFGLFGKKQVEEEVVAVETLEDELLEETVEETVELHDEVVNEELETESGTEILKPKNIVEVESVFVDELDTKKYCDDLYIYLQDNGLQVNKNSVREMFASIAASKLIIVKNEDPVLSDRFIELFTEFIGANFYRDKVKEGLEKFDDLFSGDYRMKEALTRATAEENRLNVLSLRNVKLETLEDYYSNVMEFSWNPLLTCNVENSYVDNIKEMPTNIWFVVIPKDYKEPIKSQRLANSSIVVELNAKIIEPKEEVKQNPTKLSFEFLTNLLTEGYDKYFVEETEWKKLDKVEFYLNDYSSFKMDNRLFRQLERYISIFIMFGGDQFEAMDNVLYSKLLNIIALLTLQIEQDSDQGLFQLFEKQFGLENLRRSKVVLKMIQETSRLN